MTVAWTGPVPALLAAAVVAAGATRLVLAAARRWRILDRPNPRSAHATPTPTLGGLGIAAGVFAGLALTPGLPSGVAPGAAVGTAALLLTVSDDLGRPLTAGRKLALQLLAVAAWLAFGPPLTRVALFGAALELGALGPVVATAWLVWIMNVFNFMDGIDGLTGTQTVAIGLAAAACLAAAGSPLAPLPLLLAAAAAGFLAYNAPPARIFMGDVGALSLGYLVGVTALAGESAGALPLWTSLLLLGGYAGDTTHTLLRRALRGENVLHAHREHLYQRLVQAGWSHGRVDLAALAVTGLLGAAAWALRSGRPLAALALGGTGAAALVAGGAWKERRYRA